MVRGADGLWRGTLALPAGLHEIEVSAPTHRDINRLLVRDAAAVSRRGAPIALGRDLHAIGAWAERGIDGAQLGPNKTGRRG